MSEDKLYRGVITGVDKVAGMANLKLANSSASVSFHARKHMGKVMNALINDYKVLVVLSTEGSYLNEIHLLRDLGDLGE